MSKLVKGLTLLAALLAAHLVQATDLASCIEAAAMVPASAGPDAPPPSPDAARLFATHCAMCHKPADLARRVRSAADQETAKATMATFLARHGRSDTAADAAIIDWLVTGSTQ